MKQNGLVWSNLKMQGTSKQQIHGLYFLMTFGFLLMCNCMSKKKKAGDRIKLTENLTKKYLDILSIRKYLIHKGSMLGSLQMPKEIYIA